MKISFHLYVNESLFSYERMSTRARFEKEAKGNSEMAYCQCPGDMVRMCMVMATPRGLVLACPPCFGLQDKGLMLEK